MHAVVAVARLSSDARCHHVAQGVHVIGIRHAFVHSASDVDAPPRRHGDNVERIPLEHHQSSRPRPPGTRGETGTTPNDSPFHPIKLPFPIVRLTPIGPGPRSSWGSRHWTARWRRWPPQPTHQRSGSVCIRGAPAPTPNPRLTPSHRPS